VDFGNTYHHEVTIHLGNDAASLGTWFLMFQDNAVVSSLRVECPKRNIRKQGYMNTEQGGK